MGSSLTDRATDIMAAFADPQNKAVVSSIGGEDQIKLLKYLDPQVFRDHPKAFFGYSDNTHLHCLLWNLGIPSFYGGSVMTQFAMNERMHDLTVHSLRHALFDRGEYEVQVATEFNDEDLDWADKANLDRSRSMEPNDGLIWDGTGTAEGILWGGCVESLIVQATTGKYLPADVDLDGTILFIETAEDIPETWILEYLLAGFGERGWFDKFQAVLVGRPKAWEFDKQNTTEQKAAYRQTQRDTVLAVVREYSATIPVVQNADFGHTDPQIILPMGGKVRIDSERQKLFLTY
jgi:muramoyltetrapeptide carboxypeptidase LdcA involved in peptidoglycan recycling